MGLFRRRRPEPTTADRSVSSPVAFFDPATLTWTTDRLRAGDPTAIPTVFRCVEILASIAASFPIQAWRDGQIVTPTPQVLRRPDPFMSRRSWVYRAVVDLLWGETFVWRRLVDETDRPEILTILPAHEVQVAWNESRTAGRYEWRGAELVEHRDIEHVRYFERAGHLRGLGPIGAARELIDGQNLADRKARELFAYGAVPPGQLQSPVYLDADDSAAHRDAWEKAQTENRVAVLSGGMKYDVTSLSARDLQWIEARQWTAADIARAFGVPFAYLHLPIEGGSNLTYSNVRDVRQDLLTFGAGPLLDRLAAMLTDQLPRGQEARFDPGPFLQLDPVARANYYAAAIAAGWLTPEEVRELEGLNAGQAPTSAPAPTTTEGAATQ